MASYFEDFSPEDHLMIRVFGLLRYCLCQLPMGVIECIEAARISVHRKSHHVFNVDPLEAIDRGLNDGVNKVIQLLRLR